MLPAPTTETVLIMALLTAHTAVMSEKKCSRLRRSIHGLLFSEGDNVTMLRKAAPDLDASRRRAGALVRIGCAICPRRSNCPSPVE